MFTLDACLWQIRCDFISSFNVPDHYSLLTLSIQMTGSDEPTPPVPSMELQPDSLYAVLTYRGELASWNCAFHIPDPSVPPIGSEGTLFHVVNTNGSVDGWKFEVESKDIVSSHLVVTIVLLGDVRFLGTYKEVVGPDSLVPILKTVPLPSKGSNIHPAEFSSRTWFMDAICVLHDCGVVTCDDVWLLEREIRKYTFTAMDKYIGCVPILISTRHPLITPLKAGPYMYRSGVHDLRFLYPGKGWLFRFGQWSGWSTIRRTLSRCPFTVEIGYKI